MSSTLPPPPPEPRGPRPTQPPPGVAAPEILDPSAGTALSGSGRRGGGTRKGLLVGGGVVGLLVVGGGAWAALSFFGTGAQPAEALPAGTLGYASIDLDPSGGQKIEALRTINKFPKFKDVVGIGEGDDLRKSIFDAIQGEAKCDGLDFDDDIDPWLGNRAAIAAVEDSDGAPQPVVVVQVKDADAFEDGVKAIQACGGEGDQETGYVVEGDWATIAPTQALADSVVAATKKGSLADDKTFQKWTGAAGDPGIATLYAAPSAGPAILKTLGDSGAVPEELSSQVADFKGVAATIRFTDGTLEMEAAAPTPKGAEEALSASSVADQVSTLPDDTAAVIGLSLGKGWFDKAADGLASELGDGSDDVLGEIETATGLSLPEDIDTLTDDGVVLAVGPGLDPETIANAADPSAIPVAIKLHGDADEIEQVVAKLQTAVPGGSDVLGTSTDGDTVVVGPDATYRDSLTGDGGLGDSDAFTKVIPDADSPALFYVNVNAFDDAIASLGDAELTDNLAPLAGIGLSSSQDGDVSRFVLRIGTDD